MIVSPCAAGNQPHLCVCTGRLSEPMPAGRGTHLHATSIFNLEDKVKAKQSCHNVHIWEPKTLTFHDLYLDFSVGCAVFATNAKKKNQSVINLEVFGGMC